MTRDEAERLADFLEAAQICSRAAREVLAEVVTWDRVPEQFEGAQQAMRISGYLTAAAQGIAAHFLWLAETKEGR
jgi:hypothetical protein